MKIALLGAGRIGRMHAANLVRHPLAELTYVYDISKENAQQVASECACKAVSDYEQILEDPDLDAVLIASSTDTHITLLEAAVNSRKAVLCEKPIDLSIEKVTACWERIKSKNPRVMIGFNRRFDPSFARLRKMVDEGEIGDLRQVHIISRDPEIPPVAYMKVAGGLLRDMTIHDFDLARFMLAEEPVKVSCFAQSLISEDVKALGDHDTALIMLETASGRMCMISNYRKAVYGYDQRVELIGETGMIRAENQRPTSVEKWDADHTEARDPVEHFFIERYTQAYEREIDTFVEAVSKDRPMPVGFEDGRKALELANAAYQSLAENRTIFLK